MREHPACGWPLLTGSATLVAFALQHPAWAKVSERCEGCTPIGPRRLVLLSCSGWCRSEGRASMQVAVRGEIRRS